MTLEIEALLRRIEHGDEAALAVIYAHFSTPVYSLVMQILRNTVLAQEVTQDTFLKVWQNPKAWNPEKGQFSSWLLTTARYTAIDRLRREMRHTRMDVELAGDIAAAEEEEKPSHAEVQQLYALLGELPSEQRQVVELAYLKGLKHSELAQRLGIPLGTVKTRLRLGLKKLRGLLLNES